MTKLRKKLFFTFKGTSFVAANVFYPAKNVQFENMKISWESFAQVFDNVKVVVINISSLAISRKN